MGYLAGQDEQSVVTDALQAAGYAVTRLTDSILNVYEGDEHGERDNDSDGYLFTVTVTVTE